MAGMVTQKVKDAETERDESKTLMKIHECFYRSEINWWLL
jgi:hypothetical protein